MFRSHPHSLHLIYAACLLHYQYLGLILKAAYPLLPPYSSSSSLTLLLLLLLFLYHTSSFLSSSSSSSLFCTSFLSFLNHPPQDCVAALPSCSTHLFLPWRRPARPTDPPYRMWVTRTHRPRLPSHPFLRESRYGPREGKWGRLRRQNAAREIDRGPWEENGIQGRRKK